MREFYEQCGGLDGVEPEVSADAVVVIFWFHSVVSKHEQLFVEFFFVCNSHSAVTDAAEIFGGEEAEATGGAEGAGLLVFVLA